MERFSISVLWAWFIQSTFGLPAITVAQSIGVSLFAGYITYQASPKTNNEAELGRQVANGIMIMVLRPAIALLVGIIVKQFM